MERVTSRDGTPIAVDRRGSGPALVLVAGALSDRSAGAPLAASLADAFTTLAYDRRGRGDSGDTPPYAVEREIEDLEAVLEIAGGVASVFGHSSGAVLALEAAARGAAIARLALYEPPIVVDRSRPLPPADSVALVEALLASGRPDEALAFFLRTGPLVPPEALAQTRTSPTWAPMQRLAHTLPYDLTIMDGLMGGEPPSADRWADVRVPVLVMDGGDSPAWARTATETLAAILPDARRVTIDGRTHAVDPVAVGPALRAFLG